MSLLKSSAIIGSLTMGSRLLGFVRDMLMANILGASWLSDAFFVAFKLPNFFRRLFAEGAFNAAFIPQFSRLLAGDGEKAALHFAGHIFTFLLLALLILNAVFLAFMPWLLQWFAPGFVGAPEKFNTSVELARICFPYILCISLVSLLGGILNANKRFAAAAAAPILLNVSLIAAISLLPAQTPAHALSWGVFAAGFLQLFWLLFCAWRAKLLPNLRAPKLTPPTRKFFKLLAPAALGAGVAQVNLLIDIMLASLYAEGVSYLYYADRLNQLPIGVIGVAVGTALLPMLSRQYKLADLNAAHRSLNRAIELVLLFALPAMAAFLVLPELMIQVLYQHGAFDATDATATYRALMAYAIGLPAFLLVKVLAPGFYANEDTRTPFKIALVCVGVNLVGNLILMQYFAHVGLALATSISGWLNAILMAVILHKRGLLKPDTELLRRLPRLVLSAAIMAGGLISAMRFVTLSEIPMLTLLIIGGGTLYGASVIATGTMRLSELKRALRQK
jgi:putative peptidoglycan lipid II flippase